MDEGEGGGRHIEGVELRARWRETFESVGRKLEAAGGFDEEKKKEVEDEVRGWRMNGPEEEKVEEIEMEDGKETRRITLDGDVARWEVGRAIRKLKNGKAFGVDGVVAEILRNGGDWMEESVWRLCTAVFSGEKLPLDWLRAVESAGEKERDGGGV